jgi:hypothetical protein
MNTVDFLRGYEGTRWIVSHASREDACLAVQKPDPKTNERKNVTSLPVQRNGDLALVVCPTPARFFKYDDKIQIPLSLSLMDDELESPYNP